MKFVFSFLVVIKLEGGNDHDLRTLDETVASSSNTTMENDETEDYGTKPTSNTGENEAKKKSENKVKTQNEMFFSSIEDFSANS